MLRSLETAPQDVQVGFGLSAGRYRAAIFTDMVAERNVVVFDEYLPGAHAVALLDIDPSDDPIAQRPQAYDSRRVRRYETGHGHQHRKLSVIHCDDAHVRVPLGLQRDLQRTPRLIFRVWLACLVFV